MVETMIAALSAGKRVSDADFDSVYSEPVRRVSERNWTPVEAAYVAAKLLVRDERSRVLDVGSGVGKFCHIGAAITSGRFVGVEQRLHFIEESRRVAEQLGLERLEFIHANMEQIDWREFSAFYFYNPFLEQIDEETQLGKEIELSAENYARYVRIVQERLISMPVRTRVVTYHGFGGLVPSQYQKVFSHAHRGGHLDAWIKAE